MMSPLFCALCLRAAADEAPRSLRVLSYNIHHGEGTDGKLDLAVGGHSSSSVMFGNGDGSFAEAMHYVEHRTSKMSVAVGDFNDDGFADLAIGVPGEDRNAGAVNVLYGSARGLGATGSGGPEDQLWTQDSPGIRGGAERNDLFGGGLP